MEDQPHAAFSHTAHGRVPSVCGQVRAQLLESEEVKKELQLLRTTLQASYGPLGIAAVFQPSPGGHITMTSRSEQLLQMLKPASPVTKVLLLSLRSHTHLYQDCGLFAALLSVELILRGMELGLPRHKVAMVTSHALSLIAEHLQSSPVVHCPCKRELSLSSAPQMMTLLRTVLGTKRAVCHLNNSGVDHLASLVLQSFLKAVPNNPGTSAPLAVGDRVHIHTSVGGSVTQSQVLTGILVEDTQSGEELAQGSQTGLTTALFDISLAGDLPEDFPREVQLSTDDPTATGGRADVESAVLRQLIVMADCLVQMEVGFVACQKCMHPLLKDYLREKGIVAVDRLSSLLTVPVRDLTGGQVISSLSTQLSPALLGRLKALSHITVQGTKYLVLEGESPHSSLVLCCQTEAVADELKPLCSTTVALLQQCLHYPYVLLGGGCSETILGHYLLTKAEECSTELLQELQCNEKTFKMVMKSVANSLHAVAASLEHYGGTVLTESSFHHCWFFPPEGTGYHPHGRQRPWKEVEGEGGSELAGKTCGCGCVRLSDLPHDCEWSALGDSRCSSLVPDSVRQHYSMRDAEVKGPRMKQRSTFVHRERDGFPLVCDAFLPKLKAIETANDLSSTILRISMSISEK